ncbi:MAG: hypothetical protein JNL11_04580 [Bdellovibrionaceae bacterium]|nr:hypothetical protein [Pseudobdellovibrionaceae bacterium]
MYHTMNVLILSCLVALTSWSAPYPVTATSIVTDPEEGRFLEPHGFLLKTKNLKWTIVPDEKTSIFQTFRFAPLHNQTAQMTVRKDDLGQHKNLEVYAKKWMREYPQYGFEILVTRNMQLGGGDALLVDLVHRAKNQQIRQMVLHKNKKIVILTCLDEIAKFRATVSECNQMMTSFSWK